MSSRASEGRVGGRAALSGGQASDVGRGPESEMWSPGDVTAQVSSPTPLPVTVPLLTAWNLIPCGAPAGWLIPMEEEAQLCPCCAWK